MDIVPAQAADAAPNDKWRDGESYLWIADLPRRAIAWEFLRRSNIYRQAYLAAADKPAGTTWPMVRLEDPRIDAREVAPAWSTTVCEDLLDVVSGVPARVALEHALNLERLRCQMRIVSDQARKTERVIFSDKGFDLQLEMRMNPNAGDGIFTPALAPSPLAAKRTLLMRRFADLAEHGTLRRELYPPEARAPRFARILQALDGAMTGARHREIAVSLFGQDRVEEDWSSPDNHLRDHVRRAISNGKALLAGGFSRLLA